MSWIRKPDRLLADERGVSAIEYSLLAALIGLGMVTSVQAAGTSVAASFGDVHAAFVDAIDSGDSEPAKANPGKGKGKKPGKKNPK